MPKRLLTITPLQQLIHCLVLENYFLQSYPNLNYLVLLHHLVLPQNNRRHFTFKRVVRFLWNILYILISNCKTVFFQSYLLLNTIPYDTFLSVASMCLFLSIWLCKQVRTDLLHFISRTIMGFYYFSTFSETFENLYQIVVSNLQKKKCKRLLSKWNEALL